MEGSVEKRYWLAKMPACKKGYGTRIRYAYLDVTEKTFQICMEGNVCTIGRKKYVEDDSMTIEEKIEIGVDAYELLVLAMKNNYVQDIRYAVTDEHQRFVMDEDAVPEGAYRGKPIDNGHLYTADQGIEVRDKGGYYFMARRLAARPVWMGGDVEISQDVFNFFWKSGGFHIGKVRYEITGDRDKNVGKHVWYVDQYGGSLLGLVQARVTLPNVESIGILPASIAVERVKDVTNDHRFRGGNLAKDGLQLSWEEVRKIRK